MQRWLLHTVLLHDLQELDNDLGGRSDQDLALAGLLGVVDALESIVENGGADHLDGVVVLLKEILKSGEMRYLPTEKCTVSLRRPSEREECPQRRVLPPSVVGGEAHRGDLAHHHRIVNVVDLAAVPSRATRRLPSSIALPPTFAKGHPFFSPRESQVMTAITNQIDIPRVEYQVGWEGRVRGQE